MTPDMAFECLLVSHDPGVFCAVNRILRDLSICTNICLSSSKAFSVLGQCNADLVVMDWQGEASSAFLQDVWTCTKWKKPTIVAISPMDRQIPGVHVVIRKPVTTESATKSLKFAYSRMLREHRRTSRYALMMSVNATDNSKRTIPVTVTDIGEGGVGLATKKEIAVDQELWFRLLLPGTSRAISLHARVLWTREFGRAGCEFVGIPSIDLAILHDWLKSKVRIKKPRIAV